MDVKERLIVIRYEQSLTSRIMLSSGVAVESCLSVIQLRMYGKDVGTQWMEMHQSDHSSVFGGDVPVRNI